MPPYLRPSLIVVIVVMAFSIANTAIMPADDGNPLPASGDPIWCPVGVTPVSSTGGCSPSFGTLTRLLTWLSTNDPDQPGVIWLERTYDSAGEGVGGFNLDGARYANLDNHPLTIQGGWNGLGTTSVDHSDPPVFSSDFLHIINWQAAITVNDIVINGARDIGLAVYTTGDINLSNIISNNNHTSDSLSFGAYLDNTDSDGSAVVNLRGSNVFNGNDAGLSILSRGNVMLNDVTANNNGLEVTSRWLGGYGAGIDNTFGAGSVTMTGTNQFNDNQGPGLMVDSRGAITIETIAASRNEYWGAWLRNDYGTGDVILKYENAFIDNGENGLRVFSNGRISLNYLTVDGNGDSGYWEYYRDGVDLITPANTSVTCSTISRQAGYGIDASGVMGSLTLSRVTFVDNTSGEYSYGGLPVISSEGCGRLPLRVMAIAHDSIIALDCFQFDGTEVTLPDGRRIVFGCPTLGEAGIRFEKLDPLPAPLPDGISLVSALDLSLKEGGIEQEITSGPVTISFVIPEEIKGADLAILYWDGKQWINLDGAIFDDGRKVIKPPFNTDNGYFEAQVNFIGTFVLVKK